MALFELLSRRFALGSRLLFVLRQTGRLAISCVSVPPGRDRLRAFSGRFSVICLRWFTSGLDVSCRRSRRVTGDAGDEETELRGWRRGLCASLRSHIGTAMLSAGSTLGLRAPDCAKESSTLWTLFTLRRGCVGAYTHRRHPGIRKDPPGSNLWPGGSGCISMLPTRSNVQTRAAPKRRGVGLQRAKRCACRLSLPRACRRG